MANNPKVNFAQLKVGILGIVALFFVALLIFLLTGGISWFKDEIPLNIYLSDASGLAAGAPVRINGITAGKVKKVQLSGETNPARVIRVDFVVDDDMQKQIPSDSVAAIGSDNLLGSTKFLDITKGTSPEPVHANATMKAANTQEFDQLVKQGFGVLDSAQAILTKIDNVVAEVQDGKGTIGKFLVDPTLYNSLQASVGQVQSLVTTLNSKKGTIGHLINDDQMYDQIAETVGRINALSQGLQQGQGTVGLLLKDRKVYDDLDKTLAQMKTLLTNLNAGKGTAGQLLTDDKIAKQLSATLQKVNLTLDKVNSGQGTIGQLMVNPQLYDSLNVAARDAHELLQSFRQNPKKYLSIKLHIF